MPQINYENIISQLKTELDSECAIANRYGIVLASAIEKFKGKVIPQKILELILSRNEIAEELDIEDISAFVLKTEECYYLFTLSEELILISKLALEVNLSKFIPSIGSFLEKLSKTSQAQEIIDFSLFDFEKEIQKIDSALEIEGVDEKRYTIIKELIKFISL